ncbi:nucleotidyl transferase AbiEii/AbiGii toxin family protein [Herbidospora sp. RD11066]
MSEFAGVFDIHLTVDERARRLDRVRLAALAIAGGAKFTDIFLFGGQTPSQPMVTLRGRGTLSEQRVLVAEWTERLRAEGFEVVRAKIEAGPRNDGVPLDHGLDGCYFEHHVKVLEDPDTDRIVLRELAQRHHARVSINPRRVRAEGHFERFVTQRCYDVGLTEATRRLDALLADLRQRFTVLESEQEFVVYDDNPATDKGWFDDWPKTYTPVSHGAGVTQPPVFDPALKQFECAYRVGEPRFDDAETGRRWRRARRRVIDLVLAVVAGSPWADHLVLRGSLLLEAWVGEEARDPGDLDFVVVPQELTLESPEIVAMFRGLLRSVAGAAHGDLEINAAAATADDIWTYDRVPGRRLVFVWRADGLPAGTIQLDFVCGEHLPMPPIVASIPRSGGGTTSVLAVTPELSLAWKILWLASDSWPQGKDLYDAVLLAERVTLPEGLLDEVLGDEATYPPDFSFLDWDAFKKEYPQVKGDRDHWVKRLRLS